MQAITLNRKAERQYLIWKLLRDWPALRYGRTLTRLSTTQLLAKERQMQRMFEKQRQNYINYLDSIRRAA